MIVAFRELRELVCKQLADLRLEWEVSRMIPEVVPVWIRVGRGASCLIRAGLRPHDDAIAQMMHRTILDVEKTLALGVELLSCKPIALLGTGVRALKQ